MGTIYKNSSFTIAAARSPSAGMVFLDALTAPSMLLLPFYLPDAELGTVFLEFDYIDTAGVNPLSSRACAFQEALLSLRILYYGLKDLYWKCLKERINISKFDDDKNGYTRKSSVVFLDNLLYPDAKMFSRAFTRDTSGRKTSREPSGLTQYDIWTYMIEDYSGRAITLSEDRLPALSGVAGEPQKIWNDEYNAGMWRKCFLLHLARSRYVDEPALTDYQSPGWSWITRGSEVYPEPSFTHFPRGDHRCLGDFRQPGALIGKCYGWETYNQRRSLQLQGGMSWTSGV